MPDLTCPQLDTLCAFEYITIQELTETVLHMTPSSSILDIIHTKFLLELLDTVALFLLSVINSSLLSGCVPDYFKTASVQPKPGSHPSVHSNYRPIFKHPFDSNMLEEIVLHLLLEALINYNILYIRFSTATERSPCKCYQ